MIRLPLVKGASASMMGTNYLRAGKGEQSKIETSSLQMNTLICSKHKVARTHQVFQLRGRKPVSWSSTNNSLWQAVMWVSSDRYEADIIVFFWWLNRIPNIQSSVKRLIETGKSIFAAAFNGRSSKSRTLPPHQDCVFCIHVLDGNSNDGSSNTAFLRGDGFSVLNNAFDPKLDRDEIYIDWSEW